MKVSRIIHPIGQGVFYIESLSNDYQEVNVVYDCGGFNHGQKKMENYLDSYLKGHEKKKIDAVFISHFHADHINGLACLLKKAEIKYLFLPQLTEDVLIEALAYNYTLTGTYNRVNQFLMNLYRGELEFGDRENRTRIIQIEEADDEFMPDDFNFEEQNEDNLTIRARFFNQSINMEISSNIPSGTILYCGKWMYIPFNSKASSAKRYKLKQELCKEFGEFFTIEKLPELIKEKGLETCKKIYRKVFGEDHNAYSMTLFSGTKDSCLRFRPNCHDCHCHCHHFSPKHLHQCGNPNMLYTGDFEPENNNIGELERFYKPMWKEIALIQVPHHGSKYNYHENLYKHPISGIVSVGNNNPFHHPDIDTLVKIQKQDCNVVIVTEDKSSMQIYQYED